jgi:hypothetical protein
MSNELALREQTAITPVAVMDANFISVREYYKDMQSGILLAKTLSAIGGDSAEKSFAKMVFGAELGFGPAASLRAVYLLNGKFGLYADGMVALAKQEGWDLEITHSDPPGTSCRVHATKPGKKPYGFTYTIEMARQAGLPKGPDSNWGKYPWDMLYARAAAHVCRKVCPGKLHGIYTPEEIQRDVPEYDTSEARPLLPVRELPQPEPEALPGPPANGNGHAPELDLSEFGMVDDYLRSINQIGEGQTWHDLKPAMATRIAANMDKFAAAYTTWMEGVTNVA